LVFAEHRFDFLESCGHVQDFKKIPDATGRVFNRSDLLFILIARAGSGETS
jgi:hypothetical protein